MLWRGEVVQARRKLLATERTTERDRARAVRECLCGADNVPNTTRVNIEQDWISLLALTSRTSTHPLRLNE